MKQLSIAAAVTALIGASSAFAAGPTVGTIYTPPSTGSTSSTNSPVVFVIYDPANQISFAEELGSSRGAFTYNDFAPSNLNAPGSFSFNIASSVQSTFSADLGSDPTGANLQYSVFSFAGNSIETTSSPGAAALTDLLDSGNRSTATGLINTWMSQNFGGPCSASKANPCIDTNTSGTPASWNFSQLGDGYQVTAGTVGALNSSLHFYQFAGSSATTYAGTWSFNLSNDQLTYTVAGGSVPLPAALWLLISGLGGLGVVARRRPEASA